jgi:hypothetical protein
MNRRIGKLTRVFDLRAIWKNEEYDFSTWLAQEANLALLSEEIGINIHYLQAEAGVGKFSLDILAEEEGKGRKIIIENQLETTNHDHLGKIITYAAGLDAKIIIWICKEVREEHRQAIDWLNENTNEEIAFFAVKLELWQIDNSDPAPKFHIISSPNEWAKVIKQSGAKATSTDTNLKKLEFWTKLKSYAQEKGANIRFQTPRPQHWFDVTIGSSEAHISLTLRTKDGSLGCELYVSNNKALFAYLNSKAELLNQELNTMLEWIDAPVASRIVQRREGVDIQDEQSLPQHFDWLIDRTTTFGRVFGKLIQEHKTLSKLDRGKKV